MSLLVARVSGLEGDWLGLVSGMAGWIGPRLIEAIGAFIESKLGLKQSE